MSSGPIVIVGEPEEPEIGVLAHRAGRAKILTPRFFGVYGSHDEAMERARIFMRLNPAFARQWAGWKLATIRVDNQVEIPE